MNLFKKALVASAIAGIGATTQAADLTDAVTKHSAQGLEVAAAAASSSLRVIVREQLEAGDKITLKFGKGVINLSTATFGGVSTGTNNLGIVYGSGTYTMGNAVFTTATDGTISVEMEVLTGDPVTKDSSFEVSVSGADIVKSKVAESTVTYSAKSGLTGNAKDTTGDNVGMLVTTANQYTSSVTTKLNGVIEREVLKTFISGGSGTPVDEDTLVLTITDNQALLTPASGVKVTATVTVVGDFSGASIAGAVVNTNSGTANTLGAFTIAADKKSASFTITDEATVAGIAGTYTLTLDNATGVIKASDFTATVSVDADNTVTTNTALVTSDKADAGSWEVDATIINVPYFPVGFEGTSSSIHFSNTSSSAVDVIVSAVTTVDADGKSVTFDAVDLGFDLPANSVTKVTQGMLTTLFGIDGSAKLSVTFNVDADNKDVTAYAFTTDSTGRTEISNTAYKGM